MNFSSMSKKSKIHINPIKINLMLTQKKEWIISEIFALTILKAIKNNLSPISISLLEILLSEIEPFFLNSLKTNSILKKEYLKPSKKLTYSLKKIKPNSIPQTHFSIIINLVFYQHNFSYMLKINEKKK
jgi:hypothetical protein